MRRGIGIILILTSIAALTIIGVTVMKADYWLSPPKEKFLRSWREDVQLLEKSKKLPKEWSSISEIQVTTDNSPAQDWLENLIPPIQKNSNGSYRLDVFVIHWIEGSRYGVVIQYHLVNLKSGNTEWELGRTLKLGFVY